MGNIDFCENLPRRVAGMIVKMAEKGKLNCPDITETERLLRGIMFRRGDTWRVLRKNRKNSDDAVYCVFKCYEFHSGRNTGLWGLHMVSHTENFDSLDTVAMLLSGIITGQWSSGSEQWSRALGL